MVLDRQPVLEGELVIVRPLRDADFEALRAIASDPLLWEQHPAKERAQPEGFQRWFDEALASGGALSVVDRRDGQVIGTSRYHGYDTMLSEVEIGWTFLARPLWGGPYNADLKRMMLDHAFGSVRTVVFKVHSENFRSQRAVEKLGAARTGTEVDAAGRGESFVFRLEAPPRN